MAVLSLIGTELDILQRLIKSENPRFSAVPVSYKFGDPIPGVGNATTINLVGLPGKVTEQLTSGIRTINYRRVDLSDLIRHQKPLLVYGCISTRDVLHAMKLYWGVDIDPNFIIDEPLVEGSASVTLRYQKHEKVLLGNELVISVSWSSTVDISLLFKESHLDGFTLPWPYLQNVDTVFADKFLDGFNYPQLGMDLGVLSEHWVATDPDTVGWITSRTVKGSYSPITLLDLFKQIAPRHPWTFINSEIADYNLWGTVIEFNGAANDMFGYNSVIKLRVNSTYFHQGTGVFSIHYNK